MRSALCLGLILAAAGLVLLAGAAGAGIVAADSLGGGDTSGLLHTAAGTGSLGNLALLGSLDGLQELMLLNCGVGEDS